MDKFVCLDKLVLLFTFLADSTVWMAQMTNLSLNTNYKSTKAIVAINPQKSYIINTKLNIIKEKFIYKIRSSYNQLEF